MLLFVDLWPILCEESQMVYIANGKAAAFSEVNQNEENLFLNEES